MMNTIQIKAYTYSELSDTAKEKVQYWLDESTDLFDKYEREYWQEELGKLGYEDCDFAYSVSYSQGDGASIACSVDVRNFIKRSKLSNRYRSLLYWIKRIYGYSGGAISILRSNQMRYVHDKMLYANGDDLSNELFGIAPDGLQSQITELEELILEEVREKSRELYKQLCAEDMSHFEDEYMIDMCETNEYLFDEYGNPVHHLELEKELA